MKMKGLYISAFHRKRYTKANFCIPKVVCLIALFIISSGSIIYGKELIIIRMGSFQSIEEAEAFRDKAANVVDKSVKVVHVPPYYKVQIGFFLSREEAKVARKKILAQEGEWKRVQRPTYAPSVPFTSPQDFMKGFFVQIDAFASKKEAIFGLKKYSKVRPEPAYVWFISPYYRLIVGNFQTQEEAERLKSILRGAGYTGAFVITPKGVFPKKEVSPKKRVKVPTKPKVTEKRIVPPSSSESEIVPTEEKVKEVWEEFYIEVDAFTSEEKAERLIEKLKRDIVDKKPIIRYSAPYYKVIFTDFKNTDEAMDMTTTLQNLGYVKARIIFE